MKTAKCPPHWWIIPSPSGQTTVLAKCKKCQQTKIFYNSISEAKKAATENIVKVKEHIDGRTRQARANKAKT